MILAKIAQGMQGAWTAVAGFATWRAEAWKVRAERWLLTALRGRL